MQACRLPWTLVDSAGKVIAKDKFFLSLKDFNLSVSLRELIEAGVTAFKIEGRLKDAIYVANVTAKYRQELDKIIAESNGKYKKASSGKVELSFEPDPERTFNRGYTQYFLHGRPAVPIISPDTQKSLGKMMGKVKNPATGKKNDYFTLDREHDLQNGDGICWFNKKGELVGTNINVVAGERIYPNKYVPQKSGIEIYRNSDPIFDKKVAGGADRRVAVDFEIKESQKGFAIIAKDEDGNSAELEFKAEKNPAQKPEIVEENWKKQFSKLGDTIFYARNFSFDFSNPYFVPLSEMNEWRREVAASLAETRMKNYPRISEEHKKTEHLYPEKELDYSYNVANDLAKRFYERHGAKVLEDAFELQKDVKGKKVMTTRHCLRHFLGACPQKGGKADFKEPLYLVYGGKRFKVTFNCAKQEMEIWD
jgi:23S rRNA 5-hydroxycytidine C2501 synthase